MNFSTAKIFSDRPLGSFINSIAKNRIVLQQDATMSAKFSLQTPYVVAPLPKPIDRSNGRYVVGNVYGGVPGSKKRKRSELAVGVDGESVNLYDVSLPDYNVSPPKVEQSKRFLTCF